MAEENSALESGLIQLGIILIFVGASVDSLWWLFMLGMMFIGFGSFIKAAKSGSSFTETFAEGIEPALPDSRGIEFLERMASYTDNPDTAIMAIGAQPEGTHPMMQGISQTEFLSQNVSQEFTQGFSADDYSKVRNVGDFAADPYNEFVSHEHIPVTPPDWFDPVSSWYNPEEVWANPERYW